LGVADLHGSSVLKRNLKELTAIAELIIVGEVVSVIDGLDGNFPYTEVTIEVSLSIKGTVSGTYTFRQFGLLKPRDMGNGLTNLNVTPDDWARYQEGQECMLFLYNAAPLTGVRTTVGLNQGAFAITNNSIVNGVDNLDLFENVSVDSEQLTNGEERMLRSKKGALDAQTFISFVDKAVRQGWFKE
jgi:hypothetical protein